MDGRPGTVGVVGLGTMGGGIAQVAAAAGSEVVAVDVSEEAIEQGLGRLSDFLDGGVERGKLTPGVASEILQRIHPTTRLDDLSSCPLVIESATETRAVKAEVLASVSAIIPTGSLIVTNTSSLSISELGAYVQGAERFAGLHFFNPAPLMDLVEIVPGLRTSSDTVDRLRAWTMSVGKTPIVVKDRPGFLLNALFMPYVNQAVEELDRGLASADDIDTAVRLGLGYPRGPLELLDMIGLDTHLHATSRAYEETLDPSFAPPPLLRRLVGAGVLGKKAGRGIRDLEDL